MERKKAYVKFLQREQKRYRELLKELKDPEDMRYVAYYQIIDAIHDLINGIDPDCKVQDLIMQELTQKLNNWFNGGKGILYY